MFKIEPQHRYDSLGSPTFPILQKKNHRFQLLEKVILSRKTSKRLLFIFATFQLFVFGLISFKIYIYHLDILQRFSSNATFLEFFLHCIPGFLFLPLSVGFMLWPSYIILGLLTTRTFHELDTVAVHLSAIRKIQTDLFSMIRDKEFNNRMKALHQSIGTRLPNELKLFIQEQCLREHNQQKQTQTAALRWKSKLIDPNEPSWGRVLLLWSMYTGINERYRIIQFYPITFKGIWICVICRDSFLVCFSCLVRYTMIVWMIISVRRADDFPNPI